MNEIEKLAEELYMKKPITESMLFEEGYDFYLVDWEDVKDSYPATYEHFIEEAMNIMEGLE